MLERKLVYPFCAGDGTPKEDFDADLECFLSFLLGGGVRGREEVELCRLSEVSLREIGSRQSYSILSISA